MPSLTTVAFVLIWAGLALLVLAFLRVRGGCPTWGRIILALGCLHLVLAWWRGEFSLATLGGWLHCYIFMAFILAILQSLRLPAVVSRSLAVVAVLPAASTIPAFVLVRHGVAKAPVPWDRAIHTVALAGAYGAASLAFGGALLLLLQHRLLKRKLIGFWWDRLPSLHALDDLVYTSQACAFFATTVLVLSGFLRMGFGGGWQWNARIAAGMVLWVIFGLAVHAHRVGGFRNRRLAWVSIGAFLLAALLPLTMLAWWGGP